MSLEIVLNMISVAFWEEILESEVIHSENI